MNPIKTNIDMAEWVWPLEQIEGWASDPASHPADLGLGFVSLMRWLTQHAGDAAIRARAIPAMSTFLKALNLWLQSGDFTSAQLRLIFGLLNTVIVEAGPYRYESKTDPIIHEDILTPMAALRELAVAAFHSYFARTEFEPIRQSIEVELLPLIDSVLEEKRFMGFRLIQVGKLAENMAVLAMWLEADPAQASLVELLRACADMKYPRFGTSGLRGRWGEDFTEIRARRTALAVSQYLNNYDVPPYIDPRENLSGKWICVCYDGRRNSPRVAEWLAEVALAHGFRVYLAARPTPTPVLAVFATEIVGKENVAGIMNCTASHNPSDWQGIKFNPKEGYPAPSELTNIIAARINEMQLLDTPVPTASIEEAEAEGRFAYFDPLVDYWNWIKQNGHGNQRIPVDFAAIQSYFKDKLILIDEMHGSGRGYMQHLFGELGLTYEVLHATRDIDLGGLDYANPERPFIDPLIDAVKARGAVFGMGLDTDADRFGVVDDGGEYFRPNQILAMLAHWLAHERKFSGRLIVTQTGLPIIDALADNYEGLERPEPGVVPPYVGHRFYTRIVGERATMEWKNVFVVPVGIKYIVEIPRMTRSYKGRPESDLPRTWMDALLLGGEESSGLTTRGHVPDKDGLWANLLIMDMIAYYRKPLRQIWQDLIALPGAWESFGGRVDVDASDRAKEGVISTYLDMFEGATPGSVKLHGAPVLYAGGTRYDMAEIFLGDAQGRMRHFLRVRASGTEPINRIYTETADPELWLKLQQQALDKLDELSIEEIRAAYRVERLADILTVTQPAQPDRLAKAVHDRLHTAGWSPASLKAALDIKARHVEKRNRKLIERWIGWLGF